MTIEKDNKKQLQLIKKFSNFLQKKHQQLLKLKKKIKYYFLKETQNFNLIYTALEALTDTGPRIRFEKVPQVI